EVVALKPRQYRVRHLLRFGGRQDELDVGRRLLERLEQGVECLIGELMGFVDDVDLEAVASGAIAEVFDDRARIIDLPVRRAVDLAYVEGAPGADFDAGGAFAARFGGRPLLAIEASRENSRGRGLADTADAGEEEGMGDTPALERLAEGARDVFLSHQLREALGAPFAGQDEMRGRRLSHRQPSLQRARLLRGASARVRIDPPRPPLPV